MPVVGGNSVTISANTATSGSGAAYSMSVPLTWTTVDAGADGDGGDHLAHLVDAGQRVIFVGAGAAGLFASLTTSVYEFRTWSYGDLVGGRKFETSLSPTAHRKPARRQSCRHG